ncbi:Bax inhibitor-1 family protein [Ureibacillus sp. FSL K6-8385]|uniref:Bax inhibitor-1/YccA family protein n=1 Tax=Ureibacillus terrenus TaxID=118246 RepID=A0A540V6T7_9BACL|nr:Bax inhibitor-1 family protein [Ureibacillus terrenus]MED3660503.1 Bax inhibitor-1 family protein [Ureibacillus terrenus]MED3762656.1 Bax inhibitor-1 family protein [Ureibacillus terrenus]TQE92466.1 hypothetical protein FKZ59_01790 [Ureibacillus terrenus]
MYGYHLQLVMKHFALMWLLSGVGFAMGLFLPHAFLLSVSIINVILLGIILFVRKVQMGSVILYLVPLFTGAMFYWLVHFFIEAVGAAFVFAVFVGTAVLFILLALFVLKMPRDFFPWGAYLAASLLVLVLFSFIFFFIPINHMIYFIIAALFVSVFVLFTVYDFNLILGYYIKEHEVVQTAFSLYLGLLIYLLEFLYRLKK